MQWKDTETIFYISKQCTSMYMRWALVGKYNWGFLETNAVFCNDIAQLELWNKLWQNMTLLNEWAN